MNVASTYKMEKATKKAFKLKCVEEDVGCEEVINALIRKWLKGEIKV